MQFRSLNTSFLRKQGLAGEDVVVRLEGTTLVLKGDKHGSLAIPATSVDRLRQFKMEAVEANLSEFSADRSPGLYETKIWWSGKAKPLMLTPYEDFANYREIMRGFARQVAAVRGLERLYLGAGPTTAILNLLLVGIPVLFLFAYVLWLATAEGGWYWLGAAATLLFFGWYGARNIVSRWPRPIHHFEQFEAELR